MIEAFWLIGTAIDVLTGFEHPDAVGAAIVGGILRACRQPPLPADDPALEDANGRVHQRLALLVDYRAGDRAVLPQRDGDVRDLLVLGEIDRERRTGGTHPAVRAIDVAGLGRGEVEAALRQIAKRESALAVGQRTNRRSPRHVDGDERAGDWPRGSGINRLTEDQAGAARHGRERAARAPRDNRTRTDGPDVLCDANFLLGNEPGSRECEHGGGSDERGLSVSHMGSLGDLNQSRAFRRQASRLNC